MLTVHYLSKGYTNVIWRWFETYCALNSSGIHYNAFPKQDGTV